MVGSNAAPNVVGSMTVLNTQVWTNTNSSAVIDLSVPWAWTLPTNSVHSSTQVILCSMSLAY